MAERDSRIAGKTVSEVADWFQGSPDRFELYRLLRPLTLTQTGLVSAMAALIIDDRGTAMERLRDVAVEIDQLMALLPHMDDAVAEYLDSLDRERQK